MTYCLRQEEPLWRNGRRNGRRKAALWFLAKFMMIKCCVSGRRCTMTSLANPHPLPSSGQIRLRFYVSSSFAVRKRFLVSAMTSAKINSFSVGNIFGSVSLMKDTLFHLSLVKFTFTSSHLSPGHNINDLQVKTRKSQSRNCFLLIIIVFKRKRLLYMSILKYKYRCQYK